MPPPPARHFCAGPQASRAEEQIVAKTGKKETISEPSRTARREDRPC